MGQVFVTEKGYKDDENEMEEENPDLSPGMKDQTPKATIKSGKPDEVNLLLFEDLTSKLKEKDDKLKEKDDEIQYI